MVTQDMDTIMAATEPYCAWPDMHLAGLFYFIYGVVVLSARIYCSANSAMFGEPVVVFTHRVLCIFCIILFGDVLIFNFRTILNKNMNEEEKKAIIQDLNIKIGSDINNLDSVFQLQKILKEKKKYLESCLKASSDETPTKLTECIKKAERHLKNIESLKERKVKLQQKIDEFLVKTEPLRTELDQRFSTLNQLNDLLIYLRSYEKVDDISKQIKQSTNEEQAVNLYGELKNLCIEYNQGHRGHYVKEYTHYWHNVLKDKFAKQYEDLMKTLKWPFNNAVEYSPPSAEVIAKFSNLTRILFLIQEPDDLSPGVSAGFIQEQEPCLPVKILLRPLKKRFTFHFTGPRQTARIDRPEWFLTQTLTWIKDHQLFVAKYVQPVAIKLQLKDVNTVDEFNAGLIALAAERLHTVLAMYDAQGAKGDIIDADAAFAHAVDETLGFHRELVIVCGKEDNSVLSVLTKAETFVRWLEVEKKFALAKMDETLDNEQWCEPLAEGVSAACGSVVWLPRGADWFISLLRTIEDRYSVLPQPGHRLQFLELQKELLEEWRVRLTQLLYASQLALHTDSLLTKKTCRGLTAVINAAHHTRTVLLQWAHSLHYLQLHYYRRQFQHFTQQMHHDDDVTETESIHSHGSVEGEKKTSVSADEFEEATSLKEIEDRAQQLALKEVSRTSSVAVDSNVLEFSAPALNLAVVSDESSAEDGGVFAEAPALFAHLRDAGLGALVEHIYLEFEASIKDYKKQKWHAMSVVEETAMSISPALCQPLGDLCARLSTATATLAPPLAVQLRTELAHNIDRCVLHEVVLNSWFNAGGTIQFTFDVKRNLVPAFAPPNVSATQTVLLPALLEVCTLLNLDYDDARRLRTSLAKKPSTAYDNLSSYNVSHIDPQDALEILNHRTDLTDDSTTSVMDLF